MNSEWRRILSSNCHFYDDYDDSSRDWFEKILTRFLSDTDFVGQDIEITDEIRLTIAGWAVRMITNLGLGSYYYSHVTAIKVYPGHEVKSDVLGLMESGVFYCQICLAWDEVRDAIANAQSGSNTVLHEFAHALDLLDRKTNGVPTVLLSKDELDNWKAVFNHEYLFGGARGEVLWNYFQMSLWHGEGFKACSSVDMAEVFAVATEKYFEDTKRFNRVAPDLYEQMNILYKQDLLHSSSDCLIPMPLSSGYAKLVYWLTAFKRKVGL